MIHEIYKNKIQKNPLLEIHKHMEYRNEFFLSLIVISALLAIQLSCIVLLEKAQCIFINLEHEHAYLVKNDVHMP